ncbi:sugar phosphate isomerase/epimerase family protein [Devosia submarina]|uniref:sugar phosphate isomerase/epimerase family protein n=1 Tax=Devosia submarina TaxID=1173082 RepID=UPI000D337BC9|nr:TIM barrel protein [Devosia submarina]
MLGIGSYAFRWHVGIKDRVPEQPISAADILDHAARLGVKLVQFADNLPLHTLGKREIEDLAGQSRDLGITLELGMTGCDPALVRQYLELARRLDVSLLRIAPTAEESAASDDAIAVMFTRLLDECRSAGVTLAVENHFHLPSPRLVHIIASVANDTLGVCLDVANSIACQEWPLTTIDLLAPFAVNLHLKDFRIALDPHGVGGSFVGTPLGQGRFDPATVFDALERHSRQVNTILEHWLPWQGDFAATKAMELAWLEQSVAAAKELAVRHPMINSNNNKGV